MLWYERLEGADIWLWAGRSDSHHAADSPFHAIPKISRILDASAVLMLNLNKGVNEAHYHDSILKASQEHLGDQVVENMISLRQHCSMSPERE